MLDESPRLKHLRYNLENTDLQVLNMKANDTGVSSTAIQEMHSAANPKNDIVEALMQIAGMEGSGTIGLRGVPTAVRSRRSLAAADALLPENRPQCLFCDHRFQKLDLRALLHLHPLLNRKALSCMRIPWQATC